MQNFLYVYCPDDNSVRRPARGEVPCPIMLELSSYSAKHVFIDGKRPKIRGWSQHTWNLQKRLILAFEKDVMDPQPWWRGRITKNKCFCPKYKRTPDAMHQALANDAQKKVYQRLNRTFAYGRFRKPYNNSTKAIHWAIKELRVGDVCAVQTDKDGGFCLINKKDLPPLLYRSLDPKKYEVCEYINTITAKNTLMKYSKKVAEAFEDPAMGHWLTSCIGSSKDNKFYQTLLFNIKTHKPAGCIKMRAIHSGVGHPATAPSIMIHRLLQPEIDNLHHIYRNTDAMLADVYKMQGKFPEKIRIWTADIKEFYMTGRHDRITRASFSHLSGDRKPSLEDLLTAILYYQYIRTPVLAESFQIAEGTGMGCRHSGNVADLAFARLVESHVLSNEIKQQFGVVLYGRYRDDLLCIEDGDKPDRFFNYVHGIARDNGYCLEREQLTDPEKELESISYLDVRVLVPKYFWYFRNLQFDLYRKPTGQTLPLTPASGHHHSVCRSWPLCEIGRYYRRCSTRTKFEEEVNTFLGRLVHFGYQRSEVDKLRASVSRIANPSLCSGEKKKETDVQVIRWVLPFHPDVAASKLCTICNNVLERWLLDSQRSFRISIAWTGRFSNLGIRLRALFNESNWMVGGAGGG